MISIPNHKTVVDFSMIPPGYYDPGGFIIMAFLRLLMLYPFLCDISVTAGMIKHNHQKETDPIVRRIKERRRLK